MFCVALGPGSQVRKGLNIGRSLEGWVRVGGVTLIIIFLQGEFGGYSKRVVV